MMKKLILFLTMCIGLFACSQSDAANDKKKTAQKSNMETVDVLYFHGKQRCATCIAIEDETKKVIYSAFADEVKAGKVKYQIIDIDKNEKLADKYEVTWSSLIIVGKSGAD